MSSRMRGVVKQPRGKFYGVPIAGMAPAAPARPPTYVKRALPARLLRIRRGDFTFVIPAPVNNGTQALPPQYFRTASAHQRLRRIDRNGFYRYPVLATAGPTPIPVPPGQGGGSFSHGWRRRIERRRRLPMITGF